MTKADKKGTIDRIAQVPASAGINMNTMITNDILSRLPVAILRATDLMEVEEYLQARGYKTLERID